MTLSDELRKEAGFENGGYASTDYSEVNTGLVHRAADRIDELEAEVERLRSGSAEVFKSLHDTMVFDARDWSLYKRDFWLYGVVVGWDKRSCDDKVGKGKRWKWLRDETARMVRLNNFVKGVCK